MNNLRFATIIHIVVLASKNKEEFDRFGKVISSDFIATSINVNPVVVRREIQFLKEIGILDAKKGKDGGCFLIKEPSEIYFGDLFFLLTKDQNSIGKLNEPNIDCEIGKLMNTELNDVFNTLNHTIINKLNEINLEEFSSRF